MGANRIFIHGCNDSYFSNCRYVRILLHHLLVIQMKELIELFKAYELRHDHSDYDEFNKLTLFGRSITERELKKCVMRLV